MLIIIDESVAAAADDDDDEYNGMPTLSLLFLSFFLSIRDLEYITADCGFCTFLLSNRGI